MRGARWRIPLVENLEGRALLSVFQVTNTNDSGPETLRSAIIDANDHANNGSTPDRIEFAIPGDGPHVIQPIVDLPTITESLVIDGYTQPGSSVNTAAVGTNAVLKIELSGASLTGNGLTITGSGVTLRGLAINNWNTNGKNAISIVGGSNNTVEGCFLGTDSTGMVLRSNSNGVSISGGATFNVIGTNGDGVNDLAERNLICGASTGAGVNVGDNATVLNVIAGNLIGTDRTGNAALGQFADGVSLVQGTDLNRVGTNSNGVSDDLERNVIVGAYFTGVAVYNDYTNDNLIAGNYIGLGADGSTLISNGANYAAISFAYMYNHIGAARTVIRGNVIAGGGSGIVIDADSHDSFIVGNRIGTDATGQLARPNGTGIFVAGRHNTIGGGTAADRNIISGNNSHGVYITGATATNNRVMGNYIGTNADGTAALPNNTHGVLISNGASDNIIGTDSDNVNDLGEGNLLCGTNTNFGVFVSGATTAWNVIAGNLIGTDRTGNAALGQWAIGVSLNNGTKSNRVGINSYGLSDDAERNVIVGARDYGIAVYNNHTDKNVIAGNYIGLGADGSTLIGNGPTYTGIIPVNAGIALFNNTVNFTVIRRNVIAGNYRGITLDGYVRNTLIIGNLIGTDATGQFARPNSGAGIFLSGSNNTIGGSAVADRNIISGNKWEGIVIDGGANATGNRVLGNFIGTDSTGTKPLKNGGPGVLIRNASGNQVGGLGAGEGNTIAFNGMNGVTVKGATAAGNAVLGNAIYANRLLGIDLGDDGITPNDLLDADSGPNELQNFPVLSSAQSDSVNTTIRGTLHSTPNTRFLVEFFASPSSGREQLFLGWSVAITNRNGDDSLLFTTSEPEPGVVSVTPVLVPDGWRVTATATASTDMNGKPIPRNTSEFAASTTVIQIQDDVTSRVNLQLGGYFYNRRTQRFVQTITITNTSSTPILGPILLVLDSLTPGVTLANQTGTTRDGSPYIDVPNSLGRLLPGQSLTVTLEFTNPHGVVIRYVPRVLTRGGMH